MFRKFLPLDANFFDLFERHAALVVKAAKELQGMTTAAGIFSPYADRIKAIELEADTLTRQCDELVHKTFITPFERQDILLLIARLDDIVDLIDAAASCMIVYKIRDLKPGFVDLATLLVACTQEVAAAVGNLRELKNSSAIHKHCSNVNRIESDADLVLRNALGRLFEDEQDAKTIIKWKEILENLEEATDRCEDVADVIEGVTLEYD